MLILREKKNMQNNSQHSKQHPFSVFCATDAPCGSKSGLDYFNWFERVKVRKKGSKDSL